MCPPENEARRLRWTSLTGVCELIPLLLHTSVTFPRTSESNELLQHAKGVSLRDMARVEVDGDLERALKKFNKKVTDERILAEYKKREHFTAKKKRKRAKRLN